MTEITPAARQMADDLFDKAMEAYDEGKIDQLCARFIAMQEDMAEIGIAVTAANPPPDILTRIALVTSKYQAETDPLVEALQAAIDGNAHRGMIDTAAALRAECTKRGITIGKAKP